MLPASHQARGRISRLVLNLVAIAVVGFWMYVDTTGRPVAALVLGGVSLALWGVRAGLHYVSSVRSARPGETAEPGSALLGDSAEPGSVRWSRLRYALDLGSAVTGALAASGTGGLSANASAVAMMSMFGATETSLLAAAVGSLVTVAAAAGSLALRPFPISAELAVFTALALGALAGLSRRQFREAQGRRMLLERQDAALREEAARIGLARDLHDVLAHSLGGLVIHLDAASALLDAGHAEEAVSRVETARILAANGLRDARAAVAALRDPEMASDPVPAGRVAAVVGNLVDAARASGAPISATIDVDPLTPDLAAQAATALERSAQEALTNARRHAPGQPIELSLTTSGREVRLSVTNPVVAPRSQIRPDPVDDAHHYGLRGMGERFATLGPTATLRTGLFGDRFIVEARIATTGPAPAEVAASVGTPR